MLFIWNYRYISFTLSVFILIFILWSSFCNSFRLFFGFGEIGNSELPVPVELNNLADEKDTLNKYEKLNKYICNIPSDSTLRQPDIHTKRKYFVFLNTQIEMHKSIAIDGYINENYIAWQQ